MAIPGHGEYAVRVPAWPGLLASTLQRDGTQVSACCYGADSLLGGRTRLAGNHILTQRMVSGQPMWCGTRRRIWSPAMAGLDESIRSLDRQRGVGIQEP